MKFIGAFLPLLFFTAQAFSDTPPPIYQFVSPLTKSGVSVGCQLANGSQSGCLSYTDWTAFNSKEPALGNPSVTGYVLSSTTGGVRSWIAPPSGGVTSVTATAPVVSSGGATPNITCNVASGSQAGCLASSDWNTFNGKQNPISGNSCSSNQWADSIDSSGVISCSQPAYSSISGTPTLHYQTVQSNTVAQNQRSNLNFSTNFSITDSSGSSRTTVDLASMITADTSGNAATATALAASPSTCGLNNWATGISANGDANCSQLSFSNLSGSATSGQLPATVAYTDLPNSFSINQSITGSTDAIQLLLTGNATQNSNILQINNSGGGLKFSVDKDGTTTFAGNLINTTGFGTAAQGSEIKFFPSGGGSLPYLLFGTDSAGPGFQGPAFSIGTTGTYSSQDLFQVQSSTVPKFKVTGAGVTHAIGGMTVDTFSSAGEVVNDGSGNLSSRPLGPVDDGNSGAAITIDWSDASTQEVTLDDNAAFTFSSPVSGTTYILKLIQDGTGTRMPTWPAAVKWAGGVAPTLTTTAGAVDIVTFWYDGANYNGNAGLNYH